MSPQPCNSSSSAPLSRDSSPLPPASYNPWGSVQVNIMTAPLAPAQKVQDLRSALRVVNRGLLTLILELTNFMLSYFLYLEGNRVL